MTRILRSVADLARAVSQNKAAGWLLAICGLGLVPRLALAAVLGDQAVPSTAAYDQVFYHDVAVNILNGKGFSFTIPPWPFIAPEAPTAFVSFLYSGAVATVYAVFGVHPLAVRVLQAILCGILPALVYGFVRTLLSQSPAWDCNQAGIVALLGAAVTAAYAYFINYSAVLMTDGPYLLAVAWSLILTIRLTQEPTARRWVQWGLAVGIASLLRQVFMPVAILLFFYAALATWRDPTRRVRLPHVLPALLVPAALILPWTIRNYIVFDRFLLLNSQAGHTLWNANHPDLGTKFEAAAMFPIPEDLRGLNEVDLTNELMRRGVQLILADPGRFLLLSLDRLRMWFIFWPMRESSLLSNIARPLSFGISLPFILIGLVRSAREWRRWLLLYLFIGLYTFIHVISWVQIRYRMPVDLALVPFTALGTWTCWGWLRHLRAGRSGRHSTPV